MAKCPCPQPGEGSGETEWLEKDKGMVACPGMGRNIPETQPDTSILVIT